MAGLDNPREDGYRPSRYTCNSYNYHGVQKYCYNFISDITLGPFLLNYIANIIRLQDKITEDFKIKDIERSLLRGSTFSKVLGIDDNSLEQT